MAGMHNDGDRMDGLPDISDSSTAIYTEEGCVSPLDTWRSASSETNSNTVYSPSDLHVGARAYPSPRAAMLMLSSRELTFEIHLSTFPGKTSRQEVPVWHPRWHATG